MREKHTWELPRRRARRVRRVFSPELSLVRCRPCSCSQSGLTETCPSFHLPVCCTVLHTYFYSGSSRKITYMPLHEVTVKQLFLYLGFFLCVDFGIQPPTPALEEAEVP